MASVQPKQLKQLVRNIVTTRDKEIDCQGCFEQLDQFVEMALQGEEVSRDMPLVQNHLDRCGGCSEDYEALLAALQDLNSDSQ